MNANIDIQNDALIVFLSGEIDHHSAREIREDIDLKIASSKPQAVELNFKDVSFMDSSGIGLIMGRYRLVSAYGGKIVISNVSSYLRRVMRLAGIDSIVEMKNEKEN